jgi:hypothetical protein
LAGGWAVTTLDPLPSEFRAGQPYPVGYVIRQHGQTPFTGAQTAIEIRTSEREVPRRFAGVPDGPPGHYVAQVTFPSGGEWRWDVDQTPFAPQALGTITVLAGNSAEPSTIWQATKTGPLPAVHGWPEPLRFALPVATVLAVVVFVWRLFTYLRPARSSQKSA